MHAESPYQQGLEYDLKFTQLPGTVDAPQVFSVTGMPKKLALTPVVMHTNHKYFDQSINRG